LREWQLVMLRDNHIGLLEQKLSSKLSRKIMFIGFGLFIFLFLIGVGLDKSGHFTSLITNKSKLLSLSTTLPAQTQSNSNSVNISSNSNSTPQTNNTATVDQSVTGNNVQTSETIDSDTTTTNSGSSPGKISTTNNVVVNGKNVQVTPNTDYSKTLISPTGVTNLNVSSQANQSDSSSFMNLQIDSQTVNNNSSSESE